MPTTFLRLLSLILTMSCAAHATPPVPLVWNSPSAGSAGSMPIGNGDIGLNVWAQSDGTIRTYIAKTDAWDGAGRLLRLGGVDLAFSPNPFGGENFLQTLDAAKGQIVFKGENGFEARLWVDANAPVIRVQATAPDGVSISATPNIWRREKREIPPQELMGYSWYMGGADSMSGIYGGPAPVISYPDVIADLKGDTIGWYQHNESSFWEFGFKHQQMEGPPPGEKDPLLHRTFGLVMASPQLAKNGPELLKSAAAVKDFRLDIVAHTDITPSREDWERTATELLDKTSADDLAKALAAHETWWQAFWNRSNIRVTKATEPLLPVVTPTANPLTIGVDAAGTNGFTGAVARARIYNRALSPEDIAALDADKPAASGLVADWDFGKYDGGAIKDSFSGLIAEPLGTVAAGNVDGRQTARLDGASGFRVAADPRLDLTHGGTLEILVSPGTQAAGGGRLFDKGQPGTALGYVLDTHPGNSLRLITLKGMLQAAPVLPESGWHRVVAVFNSKGRRIYLDGKEVAVDKPDAEAASLPVRLTEAYQLQRYMSAIAGRGAFPIRFNGSLFWGTRNDVLGDAAIDPDWRMWAADYWWQNTRLPYYPMLASGDWDMMTPLFDMYYKRLPTETARTKAWFGCEGAFVGETASFWGMMSNGDYGYQRPPELLKGELKNGVMRYYWQPGIELTFMMLDYYDHTGDEDFVRERIAPMAEAYLKYYATRFGRDASGKLVITPAQSLETWANVVNPTPDVAGIAQITRRILALPAGLVPESLRTLAAEMRDVVPPIPMREENSRQLIGFAEAVNCQRSNYENPELYTVYPYRNYGIGRPGLELARETYAARLTKDHFGWHQSGMQAACLGMADEAATAIAGNLGNKNPNFRFPIMWGPNYDWVPDQDHGSNLINTLQLMLLQSDGDQILLAPAWPEGWEVDFKLHAPQNTTVQASIRNGKIENLIVLPAERAKDVVDCLKKSESMMRLEFSDSGVSFHHGDKLAGLYRHNDEFKPHIHPLRTPRGHVVTSVSPHDHKHHKALVYALRVEGVNFWEEVPTLPDELTGRQKHMGFFDVTADGAEIGFSEKLHWSAIDGSQPCFDEVRRITCRYENGEYVWTWKTRLTALRPLRLIQSQWSHPLADGSKVNYHGLGIRFRRDMAGALGGATRGTELRLDGEATTGIPIEHMGNRPKEVTYIGSIDETWPVEQAGVSVRQEKDHALYVLDAPFPFIALGPTNAGPLDLREADILKDSFTIRVFDVKP